jgi:hypothetical protein
MTREFDDLVDDVSGAERERLRRAHDMLVAAGPSPELPPRLADPSKPPEADIAFFPKRRWAAAAVAAAALAAAAFGGGYLVGHSGEGDGFAVREVVRLNATPAAPEGSRASLRLGNRDEAGNWEMLVSVSGLRKLPERGYYRLWIARGGEPRLRCGDFAVRGGDERETVHFTVAYRLKPGDRWVVTEQLPGHHDPGRIMLTT